MRGRDSSIRTQRGGRARRFKREDRRTPKLINSEQPTAQCPQHASELGTSNARTQSHWPPRREERARLADRHGEATDWMSPQGTRYRGSESREGGCSTQAEHCGERRHSLRRVRGDESEHDIQTRMTMMRGRRGIQAATGSYSVVKSGYVCECVRQCRVSGAWPPYVHFSLFSPPGGVVVRLTPTPRPRPTGCPQAALPGPP